MMAQGIEALIAIPIFVLVLLFVAHLNKGKKRGDPRNYFMGKGQFFDPSSYKGNVRAILLGVLVLLIGWHIDKIGQWIWIQFGNELVVPRGREYWHRIVSTSIGLILIIVGLLNLIAVKVQHSRQVK